MDHSKHMQFSFPPPLRKQLNSCKTIQGGTDWQEQKFDLSKIYAFYVCNPHGMHHSEVLQICVSYAQRENLKRRKVLPIFPL